MLTYIYRKDEKALQTFKATTNYFLNHLPEDYIPYWDLQFTDGDGEPKDSSSAAIALCGLLEGIKHMDANDPLREIYVNACNRMMSSLIDGYLTKDDPKANGLLFHAVYSKPANLGVDEMNIWGCYFYMEALHRMLDPEWKLYW
jgi:unsaturated chondroitin disaccharide hydrolase